MRRNLWIRNTLNNLYGFVHPALWMFGGYQSPAPWRVKCAVLTRYGANAEVWIETGTYLGKTSKWLASSGVRVVTIESEPSLAKRAKKKLLKFQNLEVIHGSSEAVFPELLKNLRGNVAFWLDGHFSGGVTSLSESETPIRSELSWIQLHRSNWSSLSVFVDDFRSFSASNGNAKNYPSRTYLVDWAVKNELSWTVEHDIFVASSSI